MGGQLSKRSTKMTNTTKPLPPVPSVPLDFRHIDKRGCLDDLESALQPTDESIATVFNDNPELLTELLETGSVTLDIPDVGKFVMTLGAWKVGG